MRMTVRILFAVILATLAGCSAPSDGQPHTRMEDCQERTFVPSGNLQADLLSGPWFDCPYWYDDYVGEQISICEFGNDGTIAVHHAILEEGEYHDPDSGLQLRYEIEKQGTVLDMAPDLAAKGRHDVIEVTHEGILIEEPGVGPWRFRPVTCDPMPPWKDDVD